MDAKEQRFRISGVLALAGFVGCLLAFIHTLIYRNAYQTNHDLRLGDTEGALADYQDKILGFYRVELGWLIAGLVLSAAAIGYLWWRIRKM